VTLEDKYAIDISHVSEFSECCSSQFYFRL